MPPWPGYRAVRHAKNVVPGPSLGLALRARCAHAKTLPAFLSLTARLRPSMAADGLTTRHQLPAAAPSASPYVGSGLWPRMMMASRGAIHTSLKIWRQLERDAGGRTEGRTEPSERAEFVTETAVVFDNLIIAVYGVAVFFSPFFSLSPGQLFLSCIFKSGGQVGPECSVSLQIITGCAHVDCSIRRRVVVMD